MSELEHTPELLYEGRYADYRVLAADDQDSITTLVDRLVRTRLGCEVRSAMDGDGLLKALEQETFDVLVTDMMMPGLHGLPLIKKVAQRWPELHIIVLTGYPAEFPFVEVIHAGAHDFINKPFAHDELEAKLIRVFKERELRRERAVAESKYRSLFELSADGMLFLDQDDHIIMDVNKAFATMVGSEESHLAGQEVLSLFEKTEQPRMQQWLKIITHSGGGTMGDLRLTHTAGKEVYADVTATFIKGEYENIVFLSFKDVTGKREVERQLAEAAQRDELTGLFNKRSFQNRIEWAVASACSQKIGLALLLIDLDNFKHCNDTYGHQTGDKLLISVGDVIHKSIRSTSSDEGFRFGGDEFAVVLHGADTASAMAVAERMQLEFARLDCYGTTMSIGIATYCLGWSTDTLIRASDDALYSAKASGKNAIEIASSNSAAS